MSYYGNHLNRQQIQLHNKLIKSKHGWLKMALGVSFVSVSLFTFNSTIHADGIQNNEAPITTQYVKEAATNQSEKPSTQVETEKQPENTVETPENTVETPENTVETPENNQINLNSKNNVLKTEEENPVSKDAIHKVAAANLNDSEKTDNQVAKASPVSTDNTLQTTKTITNVVNKDDSNEATPTASLAHPETKVEVKQVTVPTDQEQNNNDQIKIAQKTNANTTSNSPVVSQSNSQPVSTSVNDTNDVKKTTSNAIIVDQNVQPISNPTLVNQKNLLLNNTSVKHENGDYTTPYAQNVRDGAGLNYNITGQTPAYYTYHYDETVNADNYTWLHYTNFNGQSRWLAKLSATNTNSMISNHDQFINALSAGAIETWKQHGVLPSISIAQAIVESAWGQSAPGNNLFGIKGDYNGQSTWQWTKEWNGHGYVNIKAAFRAYPSFKESIKDHGNFLVVNSRYANLLWNNNYVQVAHDLQSDGYATDPNYANTLINVIEHNNLNRFDNVNATPNTTPATKIQDRWITNLSSSKISVQPQNEDLGTAKTGAYKTPYVQNIHTGAGLNTPISGVTESGYTYYYDHVKQADGLNYLHYTNFNGQSRWIADANNSTTTTPTTTSTTTQSQNEDLGIAKTGAYTTPYVQNVHTGAGINTPISGVTESGYTYYYDHVKQSDGLNYLHYTNFDGQSRWIADVNGSTTATSTTTQPQNEDLGTAKTGAYTTPYAQNIHTEAGINTPISGVTESGYTYYYDHVKQVGGLNYLHYTNFNGQSRWIADANGSTTTAPVTTNNVTTNNTNMTPASGAYTPQWTQNLRSDAGLNAPVSDTIDAGYTIYYDGIKIQDNITWLHYTSFSGLSRWVAKLN